MTDKPARPGATQQRLGSMMWVQGLACGALLTFATPTALLLVILLAPAVICVLAHPGCERALMRAVASGCVAGSLGPLWHLWSGGGHLANVAATLADSTTLCFAWGGGAAAWMLCQVLPVILQSAWGGYEAKRAKAVKTEVESLEEEWGLAEAIRRE